MPTVPSCLPFEINCAESVEEKNIEEKNATVMRRKSFFMVEMKC
jgi:hypothetical protein